MVKIIISKSYFDEYKYGINRLKNADMLKEQSIVLVPQHITLQVEKELMSALDSKGLFNIDVMNIRRFMAKFSTKTKSMDEMGKILILLNILHKNTKHLQLYSKSARNISFVENLSGLLNDFREHLVDPADILRIAEHPGVQQELLKRKLQEISLIYEEYIDTLKDGWHDQRSIIDRFVKEVSEKNSLKDVNLFVDGFSDLSIAQIDMLAKISKYAKTMQIRLVTSDMEDMPISNHVEKFKKNLIDIFTANGVDVQILDLKNNCGDFCREFADIFAADISNSDTAKSKIKLQTCNSIEEELQSAIFEIFRECKENGASLNDFAVLAQDISSLDYIIKEYCEKFEIPYFLSEKRAIIHHHYADFILGIFEVFLSRFSTKSVLNFLSNKLSGISHKAMYQLKKTAIERDVKYSTKWKKIIQEIIQSQESADKIEDGIFSHDVEKEDVEILKNSVLGLIDLEKDLKKSKSASDFIAHIMDFIDKFDMQAKLEDLSEKMKLSDDLSYAQELSRIYALVQRVFDQIAEISDFEPNMRNMYNLLYYAFSTIKIAILPLNTEHLFFGNFKSSKMGSLKKLYFIHMSEGVVPSGQEDAGIFSFAEKEILKENKLLHVRDYSYEYNLEAYNVFENMLGAKDEVIWSYPKFVGEQENRPSIWYSSLCGRNEPILRKIAKEDIEATGLKKLYFDTLLESYFRGESLQAKELEYLNQFVLESEFELKLKKSLEGQDYINEASIDADVISSKEMYGEVLNVSISRLEKFAACPYQHFVDYILKPQSIEAPNFNALDIGTLFHYIFETLMNEISKMDFEEFDKEQVESIFGAGPLQLNSDDFIDEHAKLDELSHSDAWEELFEKNYEEMLQNNPKFRLNSKNVYYADRFKEILKLAVKYNVVQLRLTRFKNLYNEISNFEHGEGKIIKSLNIVSDENKRINIIGKIDRVDIARLQSQGLDDYIRVIDYKTGSKEFKKELLDAGLSLQLPIYLNMVLKGALKEQLQGAKPYGAFYFVIPSDLFVDGYRTTSSILSKFRLDGFLLEDEEIHQNLDLSVEANNGISIVEPYNKQPGGKSSELKSMFESKEFSDILNSSLEIAGKLSDRIYDMDISISPVGNLLDHKPCEYCKYQDICKFDIKDSKQDYRYIK